MRNFEALKTMAGWLYYIDNASVPFDEYHREKEKDTILEASLTRNTILDPTLTKISKPIPNEGEVEEAVKTLIRFTGADMNDPNITGTAHRVMKAWRDTWGAGYKMKSEDFLTVFPNEGYDEMIVVKNIPIQSTCSHHLAPITGIAHIAIIPNEELIGLSKYARIADMFARRLQLQERLTTQIADEIDGLLLPIGVAVYIEAAHGCMSSRGVKIHNSTTVTTTLRGAFKDNPETRAEFLAICNG